MDNFCDKIDSLLQNKAQQDKLLIKKEYNIFIIGYQLSGKSTLANVLSDQQQLYFKKEGNQFIPINDHHFPIAKDDGIGTQQTNSLVKSENQIWDFPGYGMGEDSIEIRIQQIVMMNKSPAFHIIMVFPYTQFTQDRGQNLIQLLNLISQKDLTASIIISKVPSKVKLETVIGKLQTQLSQEEIIYTDEAKEVLNQIIKNNRIQIFNYPQMIEEVQQFKLDNIKQIQQLVFEQKHFNKVKIQFRFLSSQEIKIKEYSLMVKQKLKEINQSMINNTITLNISRIERNISDQQLHYDNIEYQLLRQQKDKYLSYNQLFQQISSISQNDDIIDSQINKLNDFFISQDVKIIQNTLYICCVSYSLTQLKKIYEQNSSIKEIYILSLLQFIVDCDIRMSGVHLYIKCKKFRVNVKSNINLKGQNGHPPLPKARSGDEVNINGDIGQDGNQGEPGGIFYTEADEYFCIENITIDISGGDGGNGQDGGDGYDGKNGEDGKKKDVKKRLKECEIEVQEIYDPGFTLVEKIHYYYQSKGTPGTIGGDSGCGGQAGQQGVKGIAKFHNFKLQKQNIVDDNIKISFNGKDGIPGKGGQYGIDYIGLYQDVKSIVPDLSKEVVKNMNPLEVTLCVVFPFYAVGYFGTLALANAASVTHAEIVAGWIFKKRCDDIIKMAPSGIIKQKFFQKQLQICENYETAMASHYQQDLKFFVEMQESNKKEIKNQFLELQFPNETINIIIGETKV